IVCVAPSFRQPRFRRNAGRQRSPPMRPILGVKVNGQYGKRAKREEESLFHDLYIKGKGTREKGKDQSSCAAVLTRMTAHDPRIGPNARLLGADSGIQRTSRTPVGHALVVSVLAHAFVLVLAGAVAARLSNLQEPAHVAETTAHITWIAQPAVVSDDGG